MIVTNNSTRTYSFEESFISPSTTKLIPDLFYADLNGLSGIVITGYPSSGETYATSELNSLAIRLKRNNEVAFLAEDTNGNVTGLVGSDGGIVSVSMLGVAQTFTAGQRGLRKRFVCFDR